MAMALFLYICLYVLDFFLYVSGRVGKKIVENLFFLLPYFSPFPSLFSFLIFPYFISLSFLLPTHNGPTLVSPGPLPAPFSPGPLCGAEVV